MFVKRVNFSETQVQTIQQNEHFSDFVYFSGL